MTFIKQTVLVAILLMVLLLSACGNKDEGASGQTQDLNDSETVKQEESSEFLCEEHRFINVSVTKNPTCKEEGSVTQACSVCHEERTLAIPKINHVFGEWQVRIQATCQQIGAEIRICDMCSEVDVRTVLGAHRYENGICDVCGDRELSEKESDSMSIEETNSESITDTDQYEESDGEDLTEKNETDISSESLGETEIETKAETESETEEKTESGIEIETGHESEDREESEDFSDFEEETQDGGESEELLVFELDKKNLLLLNGMETNLSIVILPMTEDVTVYWTSSDLSVIRVEEGKIYAVGTGSATVTATAENGASAICQVTVISEGVGFPNLEVNHTDVKGAVSNETECFCISREIVCTESVSYYVTTDREGAQKIDSDTISLNIGDNIFYVHESIGDVKRVYTVTIRRRPIYEVIFDANGGSEIYPQAIEEGSPVALPHTRRTGYTLVGWSYDLNTPIMESMKITAIWKANRYGIVFDADGGNPVADLTVVYDETYELPIPIRTGYHFEGWYDGEEKVEQSGTWQTVSDLSLAAKWSACSYEITFDTDGGIGLLPLTVTYDGEYKLPTPVRTGYTFYQWYWGTNPISMSDCWKIAENVTLRAEWMVNRYGLSLKNESTVAGSVEGAGQYEYGETVLVRATLNHPMYMFLGWYNEADEMVSKEREYRFTMGTDLCLSAKFGISEELSDFSVSTENHQCIIEGVIKPQKTSYTVPSFVNGIAKGAFASCDKIERITVPFVGGSADENGYFGYIFGAEPDEETDEAIPNSLTDITVKGEGCVIGENAFLNLENLRALHILEGVSYIERGAISGCVNLETITVPFVGASEEGASRHFGFIFGASDAEQNRNYIPKSLKTVTVLGGGSIAKEAFYRCNKIEKIELSDDLVSIGEAAFYQCTGLKEVALPNGLEAVEAEAFFGCEGITSLTFPEHVKTIGWKALYGCEQLETLTVPFVGHEKGGTEDTNFGYIFGIDSDFGDKTTSVPKSLKTVWVTNCVTVESNAFSDCDELESIHLSDAVTEIGKRAFEGCTSLKRISIGKGVAWIDETAFALCESLAAIEVSTENSNYKSVDGVLYTKDGETLILYPQGKTESSFEIPDEVLQIEKEAFCGNGFLVRVTGAKQLKILGESAFFGCEKLEQVLFGDCVEEIQNGALKGCVSLRKIALSDSVRMIGEQAFDGCAVLENITVPEQVRVLGDYTFRGCKALTQIQVHDGIKRLGTGVFASCEGLKGVWIGTGVEQIGTGLLEGCNSLERIAIPFVGKDVTADAREGLGYLFGAEDVMAQRSRIPTTLTTVVITGGVRIAEKAFYECEGITDLVIPRTVQAIENYALLGCTSLRRVYYEGSASDWESITQGMGNGALASAELCYYSEEKPLDETVTYWRFAGEIPTKWEKAVEQ